jgi:hypothetical protein
MSLPTWRGDAIISECGTYRYLLQRSWDVRREAVCFVMLNPSTADAAKNDRTLDRCMSFAVTLGFGQLEVVNLFAMRTKSPDVLKQHPCPIGPENDETIFNSARVCHMVICAWGAHGAYLGRDQEVLELLRAAGIRPYALRTNADGSPAHPLYLPGYVQPEPFA